jgi:hypothetical protein
VDAVLTWLSQVAEEMTGEPFASILQALISRRAGEELPTRQELQEWDAAREQRLMFAVQRQHLPALPLGGARCLCQGIDRGDGCQLGSECVCPQHHLQPAVLAQQLLELAWLRKAPSCPAHVRQLNATAELLQLLSDDEQLWPCYWCGDRSSTHWLPALYQWGCQDPAACQERLDDLGEARRQLMAEDQAEDRRAGL